MSDKIITTIIKRPPSEDCFDLYYNFKTEMKENAYNILDKERDDSMFQFNNMLKTFFYKKKNVKDYV